jgi:hypothetical protein
MCLDQNLQSISLNSQPGSQIGMNNPQQQMSPIYNQQNQMNSMNGLTFANPNQGLICRNALGQDLTLTKDSCKLKIYHSKF